MAHTLKFTERASGEWWVDGIEIRDQSFSTLTSEDFALPSGATGSVIGISSMAFFEEEWITSVELPPTIQHIEGGAFLKCSALERVQYPTGTNTYALTTIGDLAFGDIPLIRNIFLPPSLTSIGINPFWKCGPVQFDPNSLSGSTNFKIENNCLLEKTTDGANTWKVISGKILVLVDEETYTEIQIPSDVVEIGERAFSNSLSNNNTLIQVTIPGNVKRIDKNAFSNCDIISSIYIQYGCEKIEEEAFSSCKNLTLVSLPDTLNTDLSGENNLGEDLFENSPKVKINYVGFESDWNNIKKHENWNSNRIFSISYGSQGLEFERIEQTSNCMVSGLGSCIDTHVVIPQITTLGLVKEIKTNAFQEESGLIELKIPSSVEKINSGVCNGCDNLEKVVFEKNNTDLIIEKSFQNCASLSFVQLPLIVSSINGQCFNIEEDNTESIELDFPCATPPEIVLDSGVEDVLDNKKNSSVIFKNVYKINIDLDQILFYMIKDEWFSVKRKLELFEPTNGLVFTRITGTETCEVSIGTCEAENIYIPREINNPVTGENEPEKLTVVAVAEEGFKRDIDYPVLWFSMFLPSSIEIIKQDAFSRAFIIELICSNGLSEIENNAFEYCGSMDKLHILDMYNWCQIEFENKFSNPIYYCQKYYIKNELQIMLTIPNGITEIKPYSFIGCDAAITSIKIPNTLESIDNNAFVDFSSNPNNPPIFRVLIAPNGLHENFVIPNYIGVTLIEGQLNYPKNTPNVITRRYALSGTEILNSDGSHFPSSNSCIIYNISNEETFKQTEEGLLYYLYKPSGQSYYSRDSLYSIYSYIGPKNNKTLMICDYYINDTDEFGRPKNAHISQNGNGVLWNNHIYGIHEIRAYAWYGNLKVSDGFFYNVKSLEKLSFFSQKETLFEPGNFFCRNTSLDIDALNYCYRPRSTYEKYFLEECKFYNAAVSLDEEWPESSFRNSYIKELQLLQRFRPIDEDNTNNFQLWDVHAKILNSTSSYGTYISNDYDYCCKKIKMPLKSVYYPASYSTGNYTSIEEIEFIGGDTNQAIFKGTFPNLKKIIFNSNDIVAGISNRTVSVFSKSNGDFYGTTLSNLEEIIFRKKYPMRCDMTYDEPYGDEWGSDHIVGLFGYKLDYALEYNKLPKLETIIFDADFELNNYATVNFSNLSQIKNVQFKFSQANLIQKWNFQNCTGLTNLIIKNNQKICLGGCSNLESITFDGYISNNEAESNDYKYFEGCTNLHSVYLNNLTSWCQNTSLYNENSLPQNYDLYINGALVTDLVIPENVSIQPYAFANCKSIKKVIVPASSTISSTSFKNCPNLKFIQMPLQILDGVFATGLGTTPLETLYITYGEPASQETAWQNLLKNLALSKLVLAKDVQLLAPSTWSNNTNSIEGLSLENNSPSAGQQQKHYLNNINFSSNSILMAPFEKGEFGMTGQTWPTGLIGLATSDIYNVKSGSNSYISENGFLFQLENSQYKLKNYINNEKIVVLPNKVKTNSYTIDNLKEIDTVIIPKQWTTINAGAFEDSNIKAIVIPSSITGIGADNFVDCKFLRTIYYTGTTSDWSNVSGTTDWSQELKNKVICADKTYTFDELDSYSQNLQFTSNNDGTCSVSCGTCEDENIKIPSISPNGDIVTAIAAEGFKDCWVETVFLPDTITVINEKAFKNCPLKYVKLPNGLKEIKAEAFKSTNLIKLDLPQSVTLIGDYAFANNSSLFADLILPSGVEIGEYAFMNCKLLRTVPTISDREDIFYHCYLAEVLSS